MSIDEANSHIIEMDKKLSSAAAKNDSLNKAKLANQLGSVCLRAGNNSRAGELFEKSLSFFKEYLNS